MLYQCAGITLDVCCIHAGLHHSKGRLPSSGKTWQHMTLNRGYVAYRHIIIGAGGDIKLRFVI